MMASTDLNVIIASLQMAFILMDKLPDVYRIQFRREGMHTWLWSVTYIGKCTCSVMCCPLYTVEYFRLIMPRNVRGTALVFVTLKHINAKCFTGDKMS